MCRLIAALLGAALFFHASTANSAVPNWSELTRLDLRAANELIRRNHPAAVPGLKDRDFQSKLARGYALALERTPLVKDKAGYVSVLRGFAHAFDDEHIWSHLIDPIAAYRWPGFVVALRQDRWVVVDTDLDHRSLKGAAFIGCEGKSADELGRERIGAFTADWSIRAQRVRNAPRLLIDDGNPFLRPVRECLLQTAQGVTKVVLSWTAISSGELQKRYVSAVDFGEAGYVVRQFEGGSWIGLESLDDRSLPVIEEVRKQIADIQRSRILVLDVRRNGGGNSAFADQLARVLFGDRYVEAVDPEASADMCTQVWRISPGNIETVKHYLVKYGPTLGAAYVRETSRLIATMKAGLKKGAPFAAPAPCAAKRAEGGGRPGWPVRFKLLLLTDGACFSSCLKLVEEFRKLGATQVGEATDGETRYTEVREEKLPSGLSVFSTLQAYDPSLPPRFGPFQPDYHFPGDIADTHAIERWIEGRNW